MESKSVCINCGTKEHFAKGLCRKCYQNTRNKKIFEERPDIKAKSFENWHNKCICKILKKHHEQLKDDPEHLSTEFLQKIIGIKCKR